MANCPNCGSDHIQLKRETNVNWGRAVAGWALFGVVGGAVGAVTGEDRNINACLDCGTSWNAGDLYKTLQIIKNLTCVKLDLAREKDRLYMNNFMTEIGPCLESISNIEKKAKKIITDIQNKSAESTAAGCSVGLIISVAGCSAMSTAVSGGGLILILLLPLLIGLGIGMLGDVANRKSIERKIEKTKKEVKIMKLEAENNLKQKVLKFMNKYSL